MPNDSRTRRACELVLGTAGTTLALYARAAAILRRCAELNRYHLDHRGEGSEIDETLSGARPPPEPGARNAARSELSTQSE